MEPDDIPPVRAKCRRTRLKEQRAKRHRRRFYTYLDGKERARDTGTRKARNPLLTLSRHGR